MTVLATSSSRRLISSANYQELLVVLPLARGLDISPFLQTRSRAAVFATRRQRQAHVRGEAALRVTITFHLLMTFGVRYLSLTASIPQTPMSPLHQPSCVAMRRGALPLPLELFLAFKNCIHFSDLRTHVCFYKAHPHIAALYDGGEHADKFWQRACWYSGIGTLHKDDVHDLRYWRSIAIEVVECDGFCAHPHCGEALLEYNRESA